MLAALRSHQAITVLRAHIFVDPIAFGTTTFSFQLKVSVIVRFRHSHNLYRHFPSLFALKIIDDSNFEPI